MHSDGSAEKSWTIFCTGNRPVRIGGQNASIRAPDGMVWNRSAAANRLPDQPENDEKRRDETGTELRATREDHGRIARLLRV
jgi:hypothetical protein